MSDETKRGERDRLMRVVLRYAHGSVCNDEARALCDFRDDCDGCKLRPWVDTDEHHRFDSSGQELPPDDAMGTD